MGGKRAKANPGWTARLVLEIERRFRALKDRDPKWSWEMVARRASRLVPDNGHGPISVRQLERLRKASPWPNLNVLRPVCQALDISDSEMYRLLGYPPRTEGARRDESLSPGDRGANAARLGQDAQNPYPPGHWASAEWQEHYDRAKELK